MVPAPRHQDSRRSPRACQSEIRSATNVKHSCNVSSTLGGADVQYAPGFACLEGADRHHTVLPGLQESAIPVSPYSKSHNRRMKKKAKDSLKLGSITAALEETTAVTQDGLPQEGPRTRELRQGLQQENKVKGSSSTSVPNPSYASAGLGHAGARARTATPATSKNLSTKQRQKML